MLRPSHEALAIGEQVHVALHLPPTSGSVGQARGRGAGASVEFLDHRHYIPGDDIRHLDWRAYARTDQLLIKRHQEEIRPTLDIVLDGSASMSLDPQKASFAVNVVALLSASARSDGLRVRTLLLGEQPRWVGWEQLLGEGVALTARTTTQQLLHRAVPLLHTGGLCVVVSDFLFPHDPKALVHPLVGRCGNVACLQVLSAAEIDPPLGGAVRLEDVETGQHVEVRRDAATVKAYQQRLQRLSTALQEAMLRSGGCFARLRSDASLSAQCRQQLVEAGVLRVD